MSIKQRIIASILICALLSSGIVGGMCIGNATAETKEDAKQDMQNEVNQCGMELDASTANPS